MKYGLEKTVAKRIEFCIQNFIRNLGPVSRKSRQRSGPGKLFYVRNVYLKDLNFVGFKS